MKTTIFTMAVMFFGLISFSKPHYNNTLTNLEMQAISQQDTFSTVSIINAYLKIKNALIKGDSKTAAQAALELDSSIKNSNSDLLSTSQKYEFSKISAGIKEYSKTISANPGKIDKQRKSFKNLSNSIDNLITNFGSKKNLYKDFCPMYDGGSIWISEIKEIKNPYYGSQMLTCGSIKKQY